VFVREALKQAYLKISCIQLEPGNKKKLDFKNHTNIPTTTVRGNTK